MLFELLFHPFQKKKSSKVHRKLKWTSVLFFAQPLTSRGTIASPILLSYYCFWQPCCRSPLHYYCTLQWDAFCDSRNPLLSVTVFAFLLAACCANRLAAGTAVGHYSEGTVADHLAAGTAVDQLGIVADLLLLHNMSVTYKEEAN